MIEDEAYLFWYNRAEKLGKLLRDLLDEVAMRDSLGRFSDKYCTGCVKKSPKAPKACVAARKFLDE